jgi:3-dehydroquinate synthase class II
MEFPVTTAILDKIRDLVSTLNAEVAGETVPSPTQRHSQLAAEQAAWYARPPSERARYRAEFVAVYDGQVVDHDADRRTLYLRVRERFGHKPVLIVDADWTEPPIYTVHSPRLER